MLVPKCRAVCHLILGYLHNPNVYHLKTLNLICKAIELRIWVYIFSDACKERSNLMIVGM